MTLDPRQVRILHSAIRYLRANLDDFRYAFIYEGASGEETTDEAATYSELEIDALEIVLANSKAAIDPSALAEHIGFLRSQETPTTLTDELLGSMIESAEAIATSPQGVLTMFLVPTDGTNWQKTVGITKAEFDSLVERLKAGGFSESGFGTDGGELHHSEYDASLQLAFAEQPSTSTPEEVAEMILEPIRQRHEGVETDEDSLTYNWIDLG